MAKDRLARQSDLDLFFFDQRSAVCDAGLIDPFPTVGRETDVAQPLAAKAFAIEAEGMTGDYDTDRRTWISRLSPPIWYPPS